MTHAEQKKQERLYAGRADRGHRHHRYSGRRADPHLLRRHRQRQPRLGGVHRQLLKDRLPGPAAFDSTSLAQYANGENDTTTGTKIKIVCTGSGTTYTVTGFVYVDNGYYAYFDASKNELTVEKTTDGGISLEKAPDGTFYVTGKVTNP